MLDRVSEIEAYYTLIYKSMREMLSKLTRKFPLCRDILSVADKTLNELWLMNRYMNVCTKGQSDEKFDTVIILHVGGLVGCPNPSKIVQR